MVFGRCRTPGCLQPAFWGYCGETHRSWGEQGCILCRKAEKVGGSEFCYRCDTVTAGGAPMLVPVPKDNPTFHDGAQWEPIPEVEPGTLTRRLKPVTNQFNKSWKHPTTLPKVRAVYKLVPRKDVLDKYNAYRNQVEARGRFVSQGLTSGNQRRRWHGTDRRCHLGEKGQTGPCCSAQCSLCCIIRSAFDISCAKKKTGWGRFGHGIYTSSASSKANDYSKNHVLSPWKALLLVHVVIGKAAKYTTNQPSLTQPPAGFDSVIGEASATGSLNYDEQVVYTNDAARPAYLVMYGF